jgi:hypothetical protein
MDLSASVTLIVGAMGTFQRSAGTVHLFGAIGVALKWFSAVRGSGHATILCAQMGSHSFGHTIVYFAARSSRCANIWTTAQSSPGL